MRRTSPSPACQGPAEGQTLICYSEGWSVSEGSTCGCSDLVLPPLKLDQDFNVIGKHREIWWQWGLLWSVQFRTGFKSNPLDSLRKKHSENIPVNLESFRAINYNNALKHTNLIPRTTLFNDLPTAKWHEINWGPIVSHSRTLRNAIVVYGGVLEGDSVRTCKRILRPVSTAVLYVAVKVGCLPSLEVCFLGMIRLGTWSHGEHWRMFEKSRQVIPCAPKGLRSRAQFAHSTTLWMISKMLKLFCDTQDNKSGSKKRKMSYWPL